MKMKSFVQWETIWSEKCTQDLVVIATAYFDAAEGLFQNETEKRSRTNTKITIGSQNQRIILKKYIELLCNNYNEPLNNVCNAKIKEITEIGNQKQETKVIGNQENQERNRKLMMNLQQKLIMQKIETNLKQKLMVQEIETNLKQKLMMQETKKETNGNRN